MRAKKAAICLIHSIWLRILFLLKLHVCGSLIVTAMIVDGDRNLSLHFTTMFRTDILFSSLLAVWGGGLVSDPGGE